MIGLLHAALVAHELNEPLLAQSYLERVNLEVEPRVQFAKALVNHLVRGVELPALESFKILPARWLDIYKRTQAQSPAPGWTYFNGLLRKGPDESYALKEGSLEAQLIGLLLKQKQNKAYLIEALWPDHASLAAVESRFHRLVSRLNAKTKAVVVFDGRQYGLR